MSRASDPQAPATVRLDVWLWAARWFRTRALAQQAIQTGRVRVAGQSCKPARALRAGEMLQISRGEERHEVAVLALATQRGSAFVAQALYRETEASAQAREAAFAQRRAERLAAPVPPPVRPGKRDRRRIHAFKQQIDDAG